MNSEYQNNKHIPADHKFLWRQIKRFSVANETRMTLVQENSNDITIRAITKLITTMTD